MKTQSRLAPILPAALRVGAVALAGHALLTASAQGQERSAPQRNLELRNPPLVREMAPRFGRAGEAARRIEQSPQGQSRGGGLFHHREAREAGQALRELHGTQRVNPLERTPSAASGTDRAVPGQGLPAPERSRLGKSEVAGMPSLGLPDNREKRPSGWVGGPTDLRGPARGIAGNEDENSTPPPPPPGNHCRPESPHPRRDAGRHVGTGHRGARTAIGGFVRLLPHRR